MKIEFGTTILADEDQGDGTISQLEIAGERVIEEARYVRASFVDILDRGNESAAITVQVIRTHADRKVAQLYLAQHSQSLPGKADLTITATDWEGNFAELYLHDAGLPSKTAGVLAGCTTVHTYRFVGGEILESL